MLEIEERVPFEATEQDKRALDEVKAALGHAAVTDAPGPFLVGPDGHHIHIPEPLFRILRQAAAMLARGERITLAPVHQEMSTQEAADQLNVSRPHLIKLLDSGAIPFTKTGRNRRVLFGDVVKFMEERNRERRNRLRDLIRKSEELGVYDVEEFGLEPTR
jgi:excisionase family DNA binding protein